MIIYPIDEESKSNRYTLQDKYKFRPEEINIENLGFDNVNLGSNNAKNLVLFFSEKKKWTFFTKGELIKFIRKNNLKLRVGEDPLFGLFGSFVYNNMFENSTEPFITPPYVTRSFKDKGKEGFVVTNLFIDKCVLGEKNEFMKLAVEKIIIPEWSEVPTLTEETKRWGGKLDKRFVDKKNTFIKIILKCGEYDPKEFLVSLYKSTGITKFLILGGCTHHPNDMWGKMDYTTINRDRLEATWLFKTGISPADKIFQKIYSTTDWDELVNVLSENSIIPSGNSVHTLIV